MEGYLEILGRPSVIENYKQYFLLRTAVLQKQSLSAPLYDLDEECLQSSWTVKQKPQMFIPKEPPFATFRKGSGGPQPEPRPWFFIITNLSFLVFFERFRIFLSTNLWSARLVRSNHYWRDFQIASTLRHQRLSDLNERFQKNKDLESKQ